MDRSRVANSPLRDFVDDALLQGRQLRGPVVEGAEAGRARRLRVQLQNRVDLE